MVSSETTLQVGPHRIKLNQLEFLDRFFVSTFLPFTLSFGGFKQMKAALSSCGERKSICFNRLPNRIALASAAECSAILDFLNQSSDERGKSLLFRIGCMLKKIAG